MNAVIEKGDIIALKDGREVEVLSVKNDGDELRRFDYIDRREASPMRRTDYPSVILRLLRKGVIPKIDPLKAQPSDSAQTTVIVQPPPPINTGNTNSTSEKPIVPAKPIKKGK